MSLHWEYRAEPSNGSEQGVECVKYFAESKIPVLIIANKSDLVEAKQEYLLQPLSFCSKYKLMPPQQYSKSRAVRREVFVKLATMASFPRFQAAWVLFYKHRHINQFGLMQGDSMIWWKAGLGIALVTLAGFFVMKVFHASQR
ncbi:mitochondrial Rho GTPase [Copidosoma floridanum]|uniref:mitochondrial Rho GTPase n=1 Tax=Copidosoma floridanum TaxID=29053 RepID=UPI000C6F6C65|nr:mitochondrial Rho GTPase [Copidosoma floridanum]